MSLPAPLTIHCVLQDISLPESDESSASSSGSQEKKQLRRRLPTVLPQVFNGIIFNTNITYGSDNYLGIKVYAVKSLEQLLWEWNQFFPRHRDGAVSLSVEDLITGRVLMEPHCQGTCLHLNSFNHVHMHLASDSGTLPPLLKHGAEAVARRMVAKNYRKAEVSGPQPFIQPGSLQAMLDVSHLQDSVDKYLMTEKKTVAVRDVPMCAAIKFFNPFQNAMTNSRLFQRQGSAGLLPAECQMQQGNVRTPDSALYILPPTANSTLLAADCSQDKAFAILLQGPSHHNAHIFDKKELKILAQDQEVVLKQGVLDVTMQLNQRDIKLQHNNATVRYVQLLNGEKAVALAASLEDEGVIHVDFPLVGLNVHFGLSHFTVQMSKVYSNQLCGLCGNLDSQVTWEMEGPQEEVYSNAEQFSKSYSLEKNHWRHHPYLV
ncbi:uncharacterized protein LOC143292345 [Babylonia areolata]|uniref:uncharacterized protein LOC143292345 n=1 Tax=Babylonia areolata TaxID=304850 RepID=UPI003FCFDC75